MLINYTDKYQFNTRLKINENILEQVTQTRLLGVIINDSLTWYENTKFIVRKAYKRMRMLQKLCKFSLPADQHLYSLHKIGS
jgi:hypothetical protein